MLLEPTLIRLIFFPPSGPKLYKEPSAKSNKHIIQNALAHCCLAGRVNEGQKNKILEVRQTCTEKIKETRRKNKLKAVGVNGILIWRILTAQALLYCHPPRNAAKRGTVRAAVPDPKAQDHPLSQDLLNFSSGCNPEEG